MSVWTYRRYRYFFSLLLGSTITLWANRESTWTDVLLDIFQNFSVCPSNNCHFIIGWGTDSGDETNRLPVLSRMARLFPFFKTISSWYMAGLGGLGVGSALLGSTMLMPCGENKLTNSILLEHFKQNLSPVSVIHLVCPSEKQLMENMRIAQCNRHHLCANVPLSFCYF